MVATDTTLQFRQQQVRMRSRMTRDLRAVWPALDFGRLDATYPVWAASVDEVIRTYEKQSLRRSREHLGAFYRESGVHGSVPVIVPPSIPTQQVDSLLHSGAVASIKRSSAAGLPVATALGNAFVTTSQSMVRLVRDQARDQVRFTALNDGRFGAWQRVGVGESCAFCQMLIARDATYSQHSVRFASHTNCNCEAQPGHSDKSRPVDEYRQSDKRAKMSEKALVADRKRVQQWLAVNEVG